MTATSSALSPNRSLTLIPRTPLAGATSKVGDEISVPFGARVVTWQSGFARIGGGTTCKAFLQTSFDAGTSWVDVASHAFETTTATAISSIRTDTAVAANYTPTSKALADDTIKDGLLGDRIRVVYDTVGTYTGASFYEAFVVVN